MKTTKKRVAGYVRVSRVGKREGDSFQSPEAQEDAIRAHCKARGLRLVEVAHEYDVSGGTMDRPHLGRLLAEVEAGRLDGIVVAKLNRFARTLLGGIQTLEDVHKAGGFVMTVEGGIDTSASSGAMGQLQLNLLLTLAQWERDTRSEEFEAAKQRAVARGVHITGTVPVGYVRPGRGARLELDADKAPAVRGAFELRATGASLAAVVDELDRTLPGGPSGGGVWNRGTVSRLLANRAYVGEARQGKHRHAGAHLPIVTETTFDTVQALGRRREPSATANGTKALLARVVRCASCGYALDRQRVAKRYFVYRCRGRSATGVCAAPTSAMADKLEELVVNTVLNKLEAEAVEETASEADLDELRAKIAAARVKRLPFEDPDYVAVLGLDAATRALTRVDAELNDLELELAAALAAKGPAAQQVARHEVRELWASGELSVDEQREVIASLVEAVTVSRGATRRVPLDERVGFHWKGDELPFARPSRGRRRRDAAEVGPGVMAA